MKKTLFLPIPIIIILFMFLSCSQDTKEKEVTYEIPQTLQNNQEAVTIIEEMATNVQEINEGMTASVKTGLKVKKTAEKGEDATKIEKWISIARMGKSMFTVYDISKAQEHIDSLHQQAERLKKDLTSEQISALDTTLARIEKQVGYIDTEALGISEEELAKMKEEDSTHIDLNIGQDEAEEHNETQYNTEYDEDTETTDMPMWAIIAMTVGMMLLMVVIYVAPIVLVIFVIIRIVKKARDR